RGWNAGSEVGSEVIAISPCILVVLWHTHRYDSYGTASHHPESSRGGTGPGTRGGSKGVAGPAAGLGRAVGRARRARAHSPARGSPPLGANGVRPDDARRGRGREV